MKSPPTKLSLKITHPAKDLAPVCEKLGLVPARIWKAGDERRDLSGKKLGGNYTQSFCTIPFDASNNLPLARQIQAAARRLKPHRPTLRKLATTGGRISFFIGWFLNGDGGEAFDVQLLDELADLRIALDLCVYVPDKPRVVRKRAKAA